jgi:protein gp37
MIKTKIEWTDSTWNPVSGCQHGCEYCYARRQAERFGTGWSKITDKCIHELEEPMRGQRIARNGKKKTVAEAYPYDFQPTLYRYRLSQPQKWITPRNIFVCSTADLFGDWVPDSWIDEVMASAQAADRHRYLFLTKNPTRYCQLVDAGKLMPSRFVGKECRQFWYGTSVTGNHQPIWDGSIDYNTFLSIEPLLEELEIDEEGMAFGAVNWIIIGAETGNRSGKVKPKREWIERITRAADNRGIPVFMKDSLIKAGTLTEKEMRREFPWEVRTQMPAAKDAGAYADSPTLMSAT